MINRQILIYGLMIIVLGSFASATLLDGLYAYYSMDGGNTSTALANNVTSPLTTESNITKIGSPTNITGKLGTAWEVYGSGGSGSATNTLAIGFISTRGSETSSWTISYWGKYPATFNGGAGYQLFWFGKSGTDDNNFMFGTSVKADTATFGTGFNNVTNNSVSTSAYNPSLTNDWVYTTYIMTNTPTFQNQLIYENGVIVVNSTNTGYLPNIPNPQRFNFVGGKGSTMWYGTSSPLAYDEIGFWNRSLNGTEISALYNSGSGLTFAQITALSNTTPAPPAETYNISFVTPPTPANNTVGNNSLPIYIFVNFSNMTAYKNVTIRLYNSTGALINQSFTTDTTLNRTYTPLINGVYYYNATAFYNDTAIFSTDTRKYTANYTPDIFLFNKSFNTSSITSTYLMTNNAMYTYNFSKLFLTNTSILLEETIVGAIGYCIDFTNGTCVRLNNTPTLKSYSELIDPSPFSNVTLAYFNLTENDMYPKITNLNDSLFGGSDYAVPFTLGTQYYKDTQIGFSNASGFGVYELMINRTSGTNPMRLYYCNSTYTTGAPASNGNCVEIFTGDKLAFNHTHSVLVAHSLFPFRVINGKVNGVVPITNVSYFIAGGIGYTYHSVDVQTRASTLQWSANNGNTWSDKLGYTAKAHVHVFSGEGFVKLRALANYTVAGTIYSGYNTTGIIIQYLPPTNPAIITPNGQTVNTRYMLINWTNSTANSPLANISYYKIELLNNDTSLNETIFATPNYLNTTACTANTNTDVICYFNILRDSPMYFSNFSWQITTGGITQTAGLELDFLNGTHLSLGQDQGGSGTGTYYYDLGTYIRNAFKMPLKNYSIFVEGDNGYTHTVNNVRFYAPEWNEFFAYNMNVYKYNLSLGEYYIRMTVYDTLGGYTSDFENFYLETNKELTLNVSNYENATTNINATGLILDLVTGANNTFNITNNTVILNTVKGRGYNVTIYSPIYATQAITLTTNNNTEETYNQILYPSNSVLINIYDEDTNNLILDNVTLVFKVSNSTVGTFNTLTGMYLAKNLTPAFYEISMGSALYDTRSYFVTVGNATTQILNAFLVNSSNSGDIGIFLKDIYEQPLTNAQLTLQLGVNGSFVTVSQKYTDGIGFALVNVLFTNTYRLILQANNYTTRQFDIQFYAPNSPYTFKLTPSAVGLYIPYSESVSYYYMPNNLTIRNISSQNFSMHTYSENGQLLFTGVYYNSTIIDNITGSPSGATASIIMNLTGYSGVLPITYFLKVDGYNPIYFTVNYFVENRVPYNRTIVTSFNDLKNETSSGWQVIIGMFIVVALCATILQISGNPTVVTITAFAGLIFFAILGWFNPIMVGFIVLIGALLFFFTGGRY